MDIRVSTIGQQIVDIILSESQPLQRKDIIRLYRQTIRKDMEDSPISVNIHNLCKIGRLKKFKLKGMPSFYGHPNTDFTKFDVTTKTIIDERNP